MLLKGIAEVQAATRPAAAAEMVLVRIAYVADLPTPDEAIRMIEQTGGGATVATAGSPARPAAAAPAPTATMARGEAAASRPLAAGPRLAAEPAPRAQIATSVAAPAPASQAAPSIALRSFAEIVAFVGKRDILLQKTLERYVRFVRLDDAKLEIALEPAAARGLPNELQRKLEQWTNRRWMVAVSNAEGEPTLRAQREMVRSERERRAETDPRVQEVLSRFPGTRIVEVRHTPAAQPASSGPDGGLEPGEDDGDDEI